MSNDCFTVVLFGSLKGEYTCSQCEENYFRGGGDFGASF